MKSVAVWRVMPTHQFNENMQPDSEFEAGALKFLMVGNKCRLLDKRRTPGKILFIDMDGGYFRWQISDFEDQGKHWEIPFESVGRYQFALGSKTADEETVAKYEERIRELDKIWDIPTNAASYDETTREIDKIKKDISKWLDGNSSFFKSQSGVDFNSKTGPKSLRADLKNYFENLNLWDLEKKTSEIQVMNPDSGDWIRGIQIVMAEMGLKAYSGPIIRSSREFEGSGSKERRRQYILHRLAFIRTAFQKMGLNELILYRGMASEWQWEPEVDKDSRFWSSWTFSHQVANDFSETSPDNKFKNSYLLKRAIPVEKVFMTYVETEAMNRQYLEAEALVLHGLEDRLLW